MYYYWSFYRLLMFLQFRQISMRQALICTSEFADSETFSSALLEKEKTMQEKIYCILFIPIRIFLYHRECIKKKKILWRK